VRIKKISAKFEYEIASITAGSFSSDNFEKLILLFESEIKQVYFTESSEVNLIRVIHAMLDKLFFLNECLKYPHYVEILTVIAANSNYLTDIIVVNPEYFYWIVNPTTLNNRLNYNELKKRTTDSLSLYNSFKAKLHYLKSIKRRELLRIGLRDIYSKVCVQDTTEELSVLSSVLSAELFDLCLKEILHKYGISNLRSHYCLISLGKLGGSELNYSSDIDLVLFYDKETKIGNKKFFSEILSETVMLFLNSSSGLDGGILYRIDFRLRPDGRNAPICGSMKEYLNYYENRGENWERQMLLKAGYLAGSKSLYKKFIKYLTPFIYPSILSCSPREQILKMKNDIERKNSEQENIKLLPGGIRDIEFAVQALQLLNGGKIHEIRDGNTLNVIKQLYDSALLAKDEETILTEAYLFYRRIEHYLQLMNDRQTHIIPEEGELLEKMSYYLGFKSSKTFKEFVTSTRKEIRTIYNSILMDDESSLAKANQTKKIKFKDRIRANNDLQFLTDGKGITGSRTFDSKSIESFNKIELSLIDYLATSSDPDKELSNFVRIIKQSAFSSIWYNELIDKTFFNYLMTICEYSQYSIDLVAENKSMRDFLLNRKVFMKIPDNELSGMETGFILFYFSVQIIIGFIDPVNASHKLSAVISSKMNAIINNYSNQFDWEKDYFVASFGSLGSSTLTFYSDFDIVFIARNTVKHQNIDKQFQELLSILKSKLNPFTIDCRLRPEGESSQLVWDIKSANEYFKNRARVWEYQALTKISFVSGNKHLFNSFTKSAIASGERFGKDEIKQELIKMRNKIAVKLRAGMIDSFDFKKSEGALNDIDFSLQYYFLNDTDLFTRSVGTSMIDKFELLREKIVKRDLSLLIEGFKFYKSVEIFNQLIFNVSVSKVYLDDNKTKTISAIMKLGTIKEFKSALKTHSSNVKSIYSKIIN